MPSKLTELSTFSYPIRTLFSEKYNPEEREAGVTHEIILAFDWELQELKKHNNSRVGMFDKVKHEPGTKVAVLCLETEVDQRYYFVLLYS